MSISPYMKFKGKITSVCNINSDTLGPVRSMFLYSVYTQVF